MLAWACFAAPAPTPAVPWDGNTQGGFVMALCQDPQGHVWAGTEDNGVWRYDPAKQQWAQFTAENTSGGLGDDDIYSLTCDRLGRVWVGTGRDGVCVFNGRAWRTYDRLTGPLGCHVTALAISPRDGSVWIGSELGIARYQDGQGWRYWTRADGLPSDQITCLAFSKSGTLYVGTDCDGLAIAFPSDGYASWRHVPGPDALPDAPGGDGLPSPLVNCLLVTRGGTVYCGTDAGLAHSADNGRTWRFLRGTDWEDKLAGLYQPVPPREADTGGLLLSEDYVTALAEDGAGRLYVGHRTKGLGVYDERTAQGVTTPGAYGGYVKALLTTRGGGLLVGTYDDGLTQTAWTAPPAALMMASHPAVFSPLPTPAAPPTLTQLAEMLRQVRAASGTLPIGGAAYLGEDWQTQGDWLGRYGRQCAVLFAADAPLDHDVISDPAYDVRVQLGPHHAPGDTIRRWCSSPQTDDPKALYDPIPGCRRDAEADDHGETLSPTSDGPDVWAVVTVPGGLHRLSLYDVNGDGHYGDARFRDYQVDVLPYQDAFDDAQFETPLACARVMDFWGSVYQNFLVRGPARYYVRVAKNGSYNTILTAAFLDCVGPDDPRRDANAWMGGVRYAPPDPDAPPPPDPHLLDRLLADGGKLPEPSANDSTSPVAVKTLAAASALWGALDAAEADPKALPLQAPLRLLSYRAAVGAGAPDALQAAWRWTLHIWTKADRQQFSDTMQRARDSLLALNPDMRNHSY